MNLFSKTYFQAIIGQRYGSKVLQTSISAEEYDLIRMVLHKHKGRETRAAPILDKWYIKDNNSIAPVFVLQDVASVIPDIKSVSICIGLIDDRVFLNVGKHVLLCNLC